VAYVWDGEEDLKDEMIIDDFEVAENVTSLKGCPEFVGGDFICKNNPNLKSLKGAPKRIGGDLICSNCENLESLKGSPRELGEDFICKNNPNLKNLEGAPKFVNNFICSGNENLERLKQCPKQILKTFYFKDCPNLKYIDCAPKKVNKIEFNNCPNLIIEVFPDDFDYIVFDKIPKLFGLKALIQIRKYPGIKFGLNLKDDKDREKLQNFIDKQMEQFKILSKYDKENAEKHFNNISSVNKIFFK
jgi:hypothetical protein